ncbi:STAS/SEC14 domain-containing protein [Shewanella sp. AS1]|uniref:STAS/SEC14 domain-containing protein n=1 Tax=Shewanella sp. AS1 TaxID=2907626 RepID=UPI001F36D553|nr:STAS/SEC14 domain-containing protein [Shewanella sp. AS1]MCE9678633.1 STAS/SEC14 domain-containing protein [Shewanella sp. AS1]
MIELLDGFSHDVLAIRVQGILSSDDYDRALVPAIEAKLTDHATIKLWYEFGEQFEGVAIETLWDDAKLGLFHLTDFSRVAIITDNENLMNMAKLFAYMAPCPVAVFSRQKTSQAYRWLNAVAVV